MRGWRSAWKSSAVACALSGRRHASLLMVACVAACTSDTDGRPYAEPVVPDASPPHPVDTRDAEATAPEASAGPSWYDPIPSPFDGTLSALQRGEYLARHVAGCVYCHTPKLEDGSLDEARLLSGVENLFDLAEDDASVGAIHSRNLTPHATAGLGQWTDREIKDAFLAGIAKGGRPLHPRMPYWALHVMTEQDADAIVLFVRSVPAIDHVVPDRQPLPIPLAREARWLAADELPPITLAPTDPDYAAAERGRYLAALSCMPCHTEEDPASDPPVRLDALFAGRRPMAPFSFGIEVSRSPTIQSKNLTPHETGIATYRADDVRIVVKRGMRRDGTALCPPMPFGPRGGFGKMRDDDARDIGAYLISLAPKDSGEIDDCCVACHTQTGTIDVGLQPLGLVNPTFPSRALLSGFLEPACASVAHQAVRLDGL